MPDIHLKTIKQDDCTIGMLTLDDNDFRCFTLELPDKDNKSNVSCIPAGTYNYYKRESPSNGYVIELQDVVGRSYIQIHKGNYTRQIAGCILVGDSIADIDKDGIPDVTNSSVTHGKLMDAVPDKGIISIERV